MFYYLAQTVASGSAIDVNIVGNVTNNTMTIYECISIVLAVIAILISVLPWIYKNFILKGKLNHYPNGKARLLFDSNGNIVRIDGVFEAINKSISIKNIELSIVKKDTQENIDLNWTTFVSPVTQSVVGAFNAQSTEMVRPIRINGDSIACCFIIFNENDSDLAREISLKIKELQAKTTEYLLFSQNYESAIIEYKQSKEYNELKEIIQQRFFWNIGQYDFNFTVNCTDKIRYFNYSIEISEEEHKKLLLNVDEILCLILKQAYSINGNNFTFVEVDMK